MSAKVAAPPNPIPVKTSPMRTNIAFEVVLSALATAYRAPACVVPRGAVVYVRQVPLAAPAQMDNILVGTDKDQVLSGGGIAIAPNTQVGFPCENTNEIWCAFTQPSIATGGVIQITILG